MHTTRTNIQNISHASCRGVVGAGLAGRVWQLSKRWVGVGAVVMICGYSTGCVKTLLSPKEPRSQYSRYELVRGQFAPQYIEDEFGRRKPNLRGRLLGQE